MDIRIIVKQIPIGLKSCYQLLTDSCSFTIMRVLNKNKKLMDEHVLLSMKCATVFDSKYPSPKRL